MKKLISTCLLLFLITSIYGQLWLVGPLEAIYLDKNGPLCSLQFETHRVGCEDYDLLQLLKTKNSGTYDILVNILFTSYTDYNVSLSDYRKTKKPLLKSLN